MRRAGGIPLAVPSTPSRYAHWFFGFFKASLQSCAWELISGTFAGGAACARTCACECGVDLHDKEMLRLTERSGTTRSMRLRPRRELADEQLDGTRMKERSLYGSALLEVWI